MKHQCNKPRQSK